MTTRLLTAVVLLAAASGAAVAAAGPPPVAFDQDGPIATSEGHATLTWSATDFDGVVPNFELEESDVPSFRESRTRYRGPDRASFVSGLPEGTTWFRVRARVDDRPGPWSEPVEIVVTYASGATLFRLLSLGAIVFLATVVTVAIGHRRHRVPVR